MIRTLAAPFRWLYSLWLRWCIWETENHLHDCARDGLEDSLSLREFRGQISEMRVRLALLQAPVTTAPQARAKGARQPEPSPDSAASEVGRGLTTG